MEEDYVAGQDLRSWCEAQGGPAKVPLAVKLEIVAQVADALQAAHDAGVIHRDVKPANILISGLAANQPSPQSSVSGLASPTLSEEVPQEEKSAVNASSALRVQAKLTDFGIGQVVSEDYLAGITRTGFTQTILADSSSSKTGTQLYMAPELLAGKPASTRSDIYSLGVVLYQLLVSDFTRPVATDWADDISDPLLRDGLHQCFAGNPRDRFAAAGLLAKNLRSLPQRQAVLAAQQLELAARERAAYRRGVVRAATIGVLIAAALLVLSLSAVRQSRRAIAERELARREGYAADMNLVQQAWKGHDLGRARGLLERHRPRGKDSDLRQWEWRYWWAQCKSDELSVVLENLAPVPSIALSLDGRHLAVHQYRSIVLLDLESRREMARLPNTGWNRALAFSPDGSVLAYGGVDSRQEPEITLWDPRQRAAVGHLTNTASLALVEFTRDSRYLASVSSDGFVRVWDLKTQSCAASIPVSGAHIHKGAACFSPDGQSLAIGEVDGRIRLVDWRSGKERWQTRLPTSDGVTALAFSPDGQTLASGQGYTEARVFVLGTPTGELRQILVGHTGWISSLTFAEPGDRLFSASADQTIGVWSLALGKPIRFLRGHPSEVWHLCLSADGRRLYTCGKEGSIRAWDSTVQPPPPAYRTAPEAVLGLGEFIYSALAFSRRDGALLTVTPHGQVVLWNTDTLAPRQTLDKLGTNNTSLALSPNDRWLAVGDRSGLMRIWDRQSAQLVTEFQASTLPVLECCFDEEGRALLIEVSNEDHTCAVAEWEVATWKRKENVFRLPGMGKIAVSPDGRHVAWGSLSGGSIRMWDRLRKRLAIEASVYTFSVDSIGFSPTGLLLASASREGSAKIWDVRQRRPLVSLASLLGVHSLTFSPGGQRLATGSVGLEAVKLWDVATFREVTSLEAEVVLRLIRFSWDGSTLVGASDDGTLFVWRAPSFAETDTAGKADAAGTRR